jgi:hypothetical protein
MSIKVNKCTNCGNNSFGGLGGDGGTTSAVLVSATKEANGSYTPDFKKVLGVTPIICDNCNYVMIFSN